MTFTKKTSRQSKKAGFLKSLPQGVGWATIKGKLRLSINFYIFNFFSRATGPILSDLAQIILGGRGCKFVQMKG
jgi:hypothetical protein